jgi:alkylhydroperoxidase family enzyme
MHGKALRARGESEKRIDALAGWRASGKLYAEKEKAALAWAEALTDVGMSHAEDDSYLPLKEHFTDAEISDLTFAVALMNAFNRLAIGMRQ